MCTTVSGTLLTTTMATAPAACAWSAFSTKEHVPRPTSATLARTVAAESMET